MSFNFDEALDVKTDSVEKPPTLPQGNYIWKVSKLPTQNTSKSGEWAIIEFPLVCVDATDDVDPDELAAFGDVSSAFNRISFMCPTDPTKQTEVDRMLYNVKQFCENTLRAEGETLKELIANSVHCQFIATASWRDSDDGTNTYVDVKSPAPLD